LKMSELDELRKKRALELQRMNEQQDEEQIRLQQQLNQLEAMVRPHLSPEALQRYGNLKIAHSETAATVIVALAQFIQAGKIDRVDDTTLKALLIRLQGQKKDIKIRHR